MRSAERLTDLPHSQKSNGAFMVKKAPLVIPLSVREDFPYPLMILGSIIWCCGQIDAGFW